MTLRQPERYRYNPAAASGFPPLPETTWQYLRQTPHNFGSERSRWTLRLLRDICPDFAKVRSDSAVWRRLRRGRVRWRQGRLHLHSPDADYVGKAEQVKVCIGCRDVAATVVLFGDEMTFYRHPASGRAYGKQGYGQEVRADLGHRSNTKRRLCGALNAKTGQVHSIDASKIGVKALCGFLASLRDSYKQSTRLILIWDNWPVHKHALVLKAADEAQIELVFVPTYAPWLNPIEKVWRKLKQEVLSLHRWGDDWSAVQEAVRQFLDRLALPSPELLQYVGLSKHT